MRTKLLLVECDPTGVGARFGLAAAAATTLSHSSSSTLLSRLTLVDPLVNRLVSLDLDRLGKSTTQLAGVEVDVEAVNGADSALAALAVDICCCCFCFC